MNLHSEHLTKTRPGNPPRQAPRPLLRVSEALEETVVVNDAVPRSVVSMPGSTPAWGSLRFDDNCVLLLGPST